MKVAYLLLLLLLLLLPSPLLRWRVE